MRSILAIWTLFLASACPAQTSSASAPPVTPAPEPNGIVTGRVFCADTGLPARFASVSLRPVTETKAKHEKPSPASAKPTYTVATTSVETALDGSYTFTHVAPGVYYVAVEEEGYVNPFTIFSRKQLDSSSDQVRALIDQSVPRVTVEQDSTAHADIQLQRGAAVSGTILYDDGAPASGIAIAVLSKNENGDWRVPPYVNMFFTNDRGYFRLNSLLPGTYVLQANLNIGINKSYSIQYGPDRSQTFSHRTAESALAFYGNGTPYIDQAATFTLRGDEERTGQDMTLPISKLHKLAGRVAAGSNGHFVNAATVELISATSKKPVASTVLDREDGLFHFEFVPEGDYTLRITNARDVAWDPPDPTQPGTMSTGFPGLDKERVLETYGDVDMPLLLRGDMTGITATIPAKQNSRSAASN